MSRLAGWWYAVRSLIRRDAVDRDTADEIAFHIEHGLTADAYPTAAMLALLDIDASKAQLAAQ